MTPTDRKKVFIDTKYTLSFAARFSGVAFAGFVLLGLSLFLVLNRQLGISYLADITILSNLQEKLSFIFLVTGIVQAIMLSLIIFLLSLLWAHAIAGPLVRFHRYMGMMAQSQAQDEIKFRTEDQLRYLAEAFGRLQMSLKNRRDQFIVFLNEAERLAGECEHLLKEKKTDPQQLSNRLTALKKVYENINKLFK